MVTACSRCDKIIAAQDDPLIDDRSTNIPILFEPYVPSLEKFLPDLRDEHGRLRVWTGNIGAHKSGPSSLEYRLLDASHIRAQVGSLLEALRGSLNEVLAIVSGEGSPEEENAEDWSDDDHLDDGSILDEAELPQPAELFQLLENIKVVIKCLYKLSMVIRQPAQHDRLRTNIDLSHFTQFDIQHVEQKFPNAERWLVQRLGIAITKRREYLKGRERHHEKLSQGVSATTTALFADNSNTEAGRRTLLSETTATSFTGDSAVFGLHTAGGDADIGPAPSETSYALTVGDDTNLRLPPLPAEAESKPHGFECPYCYYLISIRGPLSWARHIFDDLQPYICTFRYCPTPNKMYNRRRAWFNHEKTAHRSARLSQGDSRSALLQWSGPVDNLSTVGCPLCRETILNLHHLERHLARHHEQLALFALPRDIAGDNNHRDSQEGSDDSPSSEGLIHGSESGTDAGLDTLSNPEEEDAVNGQLSDLIDNYMEVTPESDMEPPSHPAFDDSTAETQDLNTQPISKPAETFVESDAFPGQKVPTSEHATAGIETIPEDQPLEERVKRIQQRVSAMTERKEARTQKYPPNLDRQTKQQATEPFSTRLPPSV
ncbi:hypothetical protein AJ78_07565 [Emergomyces pasteurianus Ep9510]|uniref:C2H2-type domain-containing protein n=1 Tax=Emergomyces pasteurianus Ep9510 TaxID=1447872 RepID=A0A1J9P5P5_9EURO|nr:hypothetical protein AJ78_07565 [Emergomyces pasteurianus Ep9510]